MPAPLAYLLTWTTYGSWLPGDSRGWVDDRRVGIHAPDQKLYEANRSRLTDYPVTLTLTERNIVEKAIRDHCDIRMWSLHALNVRSNHVHLVVTAPQSPEEVMVQFKAWASRKLNESMQGGVARKWWTQHGSTKWINDHSYFENAVRYVNEGQ